MNFLLFTTRSQVVTCAGPARARRGAEMGDAQIRRDVGVLVRGDRIAAVAPPDELERAHPDARRIDCGRRLLTPGLVDSHTHAVFGRGRYDEQEVRAAGATYMEIARRGGGIHASVRDVRARDADDLLAVAERRLRSLASYGTTTVEIKSGYGLTVDDELKLLRVIARASERTPMRVVPTWLGAHEIPPEHRERGDGGASYVNMLVNEMLPAVTTQRLARFADVFCEPGVFTVDQTRTILEASRRAGLALKLHADELEPSGGAELAVELSATSADHLAAVSAERNLRPRPVRDGRHPAARHNALPWPPPSGAGPGAHRGGRRRRPGDRLQPRHITHRQLSPHPDARRQPAAHVRCRNDRCRDGERRRCARDRRPRRTDCPGLFCRPRAF